MSPTWCKSTAEPTLARSRAALKKEIHVNLIDASIEARGFAPVSIALAVRTISACFAALHRPDNRILTGIGLLASTLDSAGDYAFALDARCLEDGDGIIDLLDWLEDRLSDDGAIVSWPNWGSVPARLIALANPDRHRRIVAAAADTAGRWRDMPQGHVWHLKQARANAMPCLCGSSVRVDECDGAMPMALLPDPNTTAQQLKREAIAGCQAWARGFGAFDDHAHPAQRALRALDRWQAPRSPAD